LGSLDVISRRFTTEEEIDLAAEILTDRIRVLRAMSPFGSDEEEVEVNWVQSGSNGPQKPKQATQKK
jgi:hypothetical protein